MKTALAIITLLLGVFITLPIWFYLIYKILILVNATELMWFLFWIYLPITTLMTILGRVAENIKE